MRGKEEAADYRYFPEPDIPAVVLDDEFIQKYSQIPELPDQKIQKYVNEYKISAYDAGVLTSEPEYAAFFEELLKNEVDIKLAVSWMSTELLGRLNKKGLKLQDTPVSTKTLSDLIKRISDKTISNKAAKDVLDFLMENPVSADEAIEKLGLKQVSDEGAILTIIDEVFKANPKQVEQYKAGKEALIGFFVGQIMKASIGIANPAVVNNLLIEKLCQ